jgi:hypothetical protein
VMGEKKQSMGNRIIQTYILEEPMKERKKPLILTP